jgi:hypothetical protein
VSSEKPVAKLDTKQDESDLLEMADAQIKFVTERRSFRNQDFIRILNTFGETGGFENILEVIKSSESSIELLFYLVDSLGKFSILLHKSFIDSYLERLRQAVLSKIINANEA